MKFSDLTSLWSTQGTLECNTLIASAAWWASLCVHVSASSFSPVLFYFITSPFSPPLPSSNDIIVIEVRGRVSYLSRTSQEISKSECSHSYKFPPSMYSVMIHNSCCSTKQAPNISRMLGWRNLMRMYSRSER